ncbi:ABC transporter ATP-binding protein [Alteraurantiacibacter aestuarii]|uniref:Spermidine/putrescine import ATP-binding protein PotA n=1 Tax=Alteraurantiacibacter aestuarii TaxID=650004 RepID=A0A844ZHZ2_9SPHN|nr:ABC transporter ATP-binding protein [Alteraurantiacibacter aestuarii]MXO88121.1 polyamine ABC transporter ATP-binding protein [Alteraurantiacibacter aestuarii]
MVKAVELRGVVKRYGPTLAADHVSLTAKQGSFTTLLGPSGCGKTTLLRLIAGLEQPDEGEILIGGRSMAGVPLHKRKIGLVFQNYALFPHLSVHENIAFGLRYHGIDKGEEQDRVLAMLDLVRLPGRGDARPGMLSGGQRQRVALARALVIEPDVLLLDEPLSALDANLRDEMRIELRAIQERLGVTTIFVTHDQGEALAMSDAIAVLRSGRLQQVGSPAEIYNRPASPFVGNFLGQCNILRGTVQQANGDKVTAEVDNIGAVHAVTGGDALSPGMPVDLVVRAEKLRLSVAGSEPGDASGAAFAGRIEAVDYQGQAVRYLVDAAGQSLYVQTFLEGAPLPAGTDVALTFAADDCLAFAAVEEPA